MKYSVKIGSVWNIPIELHLTFILLIGGILALAFLYNAFYDFALILLLFVFVVVHELAHSVVARSYHINVQKIVLYPIGGVSEIEEIPENPRMEWRMAAAGPLSSMAIGGLFLAVSLYTPIATTNPAQSVLLSTGSFSLDLGVLNLFLGLFNLIPAFPMDGGRVLRALLAERMSFSDATKNAALIGRTIGILMVIVGFLFNFNIFLSIIGIFVYIGASEEAEQTILSTTLAGVRVRDVMSPEIAVVNPETSLPDALEVMLKARYHDLLVEKNGDFEGIITWAEIVKIKAENRKEFRVEQLPLKQLSISPDESILEAYKVISRQKIDLLPVVEKEKPLKVVGIVTSKSVADAYEKARAQR